LTQDGHLVLAHYRRMQDKARLAIAEDVAALRQRFDMAGRK
jgi:molybdate transport system regulatory protein